MRSVVAGIVVIALAAWLHAQFRAQNSASVGQVSTQINPELYGHGTTNSIKYAPISSRPTDSEVRNAYWRSGATPSEVAMGAARLGPLDAGGPMAYIPPPPSYLSKPKASTPAALPASTYSTGASIRYSTPASVAPSYMPSASVRPAVVSSGPINAGPINNSVRYAR